MGTRTVVVSELLDVCKPGKGLTESQSSGFSFTPRAYGCALNPVPEWGQQDDSVGRGACSQTYREGWGEKGKNKFIK